MIINRRWAMPNKWTFTIKPIKELLSRYVGDGVGWIDPFAGMNSPAEITNDLNPDRPTKYHLHAEDFLNIIVDRGNDFTGCLFDPPYSPHQTKECYEGFGINMKYEDDGRHGWSKTRALISEALGGNGICISCGWNTVGIGKKRGFEIVEILLVSHGIGHNDTIVTVEKKVNNTLDAYI